MTDSDGRSTAARKPWVVALAFTIVLSTYLYQIARPWPVGVEILKNYSGEIALPISFRQSWSETFSYHRASYLLLPSLREVTIRQLNHAPPEVQIQARGKYIFVGLTLLAAYVLWQIRRRRSDRSPNQRLERP